MLPDESQVHGPRWAAFGTWAAALLLLGAVTVGCAREDPSKAVRTEEIAVVSAKHFANASSDVVLADGAKRTVVGWAVEDRPHRLALAIAANGDVLDARPLDGPPLPEPASGPPAEVPVLGVGESGLVLTMATLGLFVLLAFGLSLSAKRREAGVHIFAVLYALAVLGVSWLALRGPITLMREGKRVEAIVVEARTFRLASGKGGKGGPAWELGVRRLDPDGSHRFFVGPVSEQAYRRFPVGSRVTALVVPGRPSIFAIGQEASLPYLGPLFLVGTALVALVFIGFFTKPDDSPFS